MTGTEPSDKPDPSPGASTTAATGADGARTLEFEIEVAGSPEEVWAAIATGPGISSWYVPHTVEERAGGAASARFGPGDDMEVPGRVADWDPPKRVRFDGGDADEGLAFEWTVEASSGDTCTVRLVNSGFGPGEEWDAMYDGLRGGWPMFLRNLQLHCQHFRGQHATAMLPTGSWPGSPADAWPALLDAVGLSAPVELGTRIELGGDTGAEAEADANGGPPTLGGVVVDVADHRLAILLDRPARGTAFLAAEPGFTPESVELSVWSYLYGSDREAIVARDQSRWSAWLAHRA